MLRKNLSCFWDKVKIAFDSETTASVDTIRDRKAGNNIYAPNFEEVEGAYWFGPVRLSVRRSITPFVGCKTREPLELGT